jgi:hypothetical protein
VLVLPRQNSSNACKNGYEFVFRKILTGASINIISCLTLFPLFIYSPHNSVAQSTYQCSDTGGALMGTFACDSGSRRIFCDRAPISLGVELRCTGSGSTIDLHCSHVKLGGAAFTCEAAIDPMFDASLPDK